MAPSPPRVLSIDRAQGTYIRTSTVPIKPTLRQIDPRLTGSRANLSLESGTSKENVAAQKSLGEPLGRVRAGAVIFQMNAAHPT